MLRKVRSRVGSWLLNWLARRAGVEVVPPRLGWPDGHYYSPIPDLGWVKQNERLIFADPGALPAIDLYVTEQLELLPQLGQLAAEQPLSSMPDELHRYHFSNTFFGAGDATVLTAMLRLIQPRRLVEVGSGFSSALILDTIDAQSLRTECTFIDPEPDRLMALLRESDREAVRIVAQPVQLVPAAVFAQLGPGDMLFLDTSHVAKVGSDVNYLLSEVLPRLPPGVSVHIHDIPWPFEYPPEWIYEGRVWSEAYLVRAFLTGNTRVKVIWFNDYMWKNYRDHTGHQMPLVWREHRGLSLWLETV